MAAVAITADIILLTACVSVFTWVVSNRLTTALEKHTAPHEIDHASAYIRTPVLVYFWFLLFNAVLDGVGGGMGTTGLIAVKWGGAAFVFVFLHGLVPFDHYFPRAVLVGFAAVPCSGRLFMARESPLSFVVALFPVILYVMLYMWEHFRRLGMKEESERKPAAVPNTYT